MSKKIQSRAIYNHEDDSSMSSAEAELGTPLSDTEETTTKTSSDLGSLVDDMNSVGFNSDQAIGSVGRSNASSGMSSIPTPQRVRRTRRLQVDTNIPSGREAPVNLPLDEGTIFSPLSRRRSDGLSQFPTMSDSSDTIIERSISRDNFYENTIREKKEEKKKNSLGAAGAGDEPDSESDLSFDGDDDDGVVVELEAETCPWIYITDKDYTDFLQDILSAYMELRERPDLQERILDHLNLIRTNIPQADQERVNQLTQVLTYLQGLRSGMISYPDEQEHTDIGSKRKRGGKKRRTRKHKKTRSKKQKGGNIYSELLRAMLLQIGEYGPREGDWEAVIRVLDQGADINEADDKGRTPLYIASERGHVEVVKFLLERGADINNAKYGRSSPLFIASAMSHVEVVRILLENGASVNMANDDEQTPLYVASEMGNKEVVRILLENGASVNMADYKGRTPLMIASNSGDLEVVEALLEYGANLNAKTNEGYTAFQMFNPPEDFPEMEILLKTSQQKGLVTENIKEYERPNIPTLRSLAHSQLDTESTSAVNENKLFQPGKLGGKKRRTRKHKNARGGGGCMSTEPDEYWSHVSSRKKVHWDTGKIGSESGKTPHTIDSVDKFKRNHKKTIPLDKTIFGSKEWFDTYSSGGGKSKKTTKRRKVMKRRKTIKRKPRKKTYKKNRQTKRRSTRRRR